MDENNRPVSLMDASRELKTDAQQVEKITESQGGGTHETVEKSRQKEYNNGKRKKGLFIGFNKKKDISYESATAEIEAFRKERDEVKSEAEDTPITELLNLDQHIFDHEEDKQKVEAEPQQTVEADNSIDAQVQDKAYVDVQMDGIKVDPKEESLPGKHNVRPETEEQEEETEKEPNSDFVFETGEEDDRAIENNVVQVDGDNPEPGFHTADLDGNIDESGVLEGTSAKNLEGIFDSDVTLADRLYGLVNDDSKLVDYMKIPYELLNNVDTIRPMNPVVIQDDMDPSDEIDGYVREKDGKYEVIALRKLKVAVLRLSDAEAQMARLDESLKTRDDLKLSERVPRYMSEGIILNAKSGNSDIKRLCNATEDKAIAEILADLNDIPVNIMTNLLKAGCLIPELLTFVDIGLKLPEAAMIGELSATEQSKVHRAILEAGCMDQPEKLSKTNVVDLCKAIRQNPDISIPELKDILVKEKVYTLTESQLQALVRRLAYTQLHEQSDTNQ